MVLDFEFNTRVRVQTEAHQLGIAVWPYLRCVRDEGSIQSERSDL